LRGDRPVRDSVAHFALCAEQDFESLRGQWMMDKDGYVFVYSMDSRISLHVRAVLPSLPLLLLMANPLCRVFCTGIATVFRPASADQRKPPSAAADYPGGQQEGRGRPRPEQVPSEHGGRPADSPLVQRALHRDKCFDRSERDGGVRDVCARGASEESAQAQEERVRHSVASLAEGLARRGACSFGLWSMTPTSTVGVGDSPNRLQWGGEGRTREHGHPRCQYRHYS
jgi:hypothetical protein